MKRPAAGIFDAQDGFVAPVPRRVVTTAIAEPKERDRKDLRILQDEEEIALALAGGRRPAEVSTLGFDQHEEVLVAFADRIGVKVDGAAALQGQPS